MCVGETRRLVANSSLKDGLTRRQAALTDELMSKVAPALPGRGQADGGVS